MPAPGGRCRFDGGAESNLRWLREKWGGVRVITEAQAAEALARRFEALPKLLDQDDDLRRRGVALCTTCLIGIDSIPFLVTLERGMKIGLARGPFLMRSWDFAVRGTIAGWERFWQVVPPPGWHDLFALTKHGEMTIEGNIYPFMAHLQVMKDLLALPRQFRES
jgi:hypothetical protein